MESKKEKSSLSISSIVNATNDFDITNDDSIETNLFFQPIEKGIENDAFVPLTFNYDELLIAKNNSISALNDALLKEIDKITKKIEPFAKNVDIKYVNNSIEMIEHICKAKFSAVPIDGHAWQNFETDAVEIVLEILNVEIDDTTVLKNTDAIAPYIDELNYGLFLDNLSDQDLNDKLVEINLNLDDHKNYFSNAESYKNVVLEYIPDTACYETWTAKILITPLKDHYWENGTQISYVTTIFLTNVNLKENLISTSEISNLNIFDGQIVIEDINESSLNDFGRNFDWNNQEYHVLFGNATIKDVDFEYVEDSVSINGSIYLIALNVKPKEGFSWKDSGLKDTKKVYIQLNNVIDYDNEYQQQLLEQEKKMEKIQIKVDIAPVIHIDLWWNKEFVSKTDVLQEILKDSNLWKIFKQIEEANKGIDVLYWIKNSPKLISWSQASIDVGVKPKNGFCWNDGQQYERKMNVIITGFYIKV